MEQLLYLYIQLYSHYQDSNPKHMVKGTELLATQTATCGFETTDLIKIKPTKSYSNNAPIIQCEKRNITKPKSQIESPKFQ